MKQKRFMIVLALIIIVSLVFYFMPVEKEGHVVFSTGEPVSVSEVNNSQIQIKVLSVWYLPVYENDTSMVNLTEVHEFGQFPRTISWLESRVTNLSDLLVPALTNGSMYHGYKDESAVPMLNYSIYANYSFYVGMPRLPNYQPDYIRMLNGSGFDVCDYVDNQGVKEVWIFRYVTGGVWESNMAMGRVSEQFWNKNGYGDISNSARVNDLPVCNNTYTAYGYNYARWLGEALENHGHQIEAVLKQYDGGWFNEYFVGYPCGVEYNPYRCGWTHTPPNSIKHCNEYGPGWFNTTPEISDCEDWSPNASGPTKLINCSTWKDVFVDPYRNENYDCPRDGGTAFKIWWMMNLPGRDSGLVYNNKTLRNWWDFVGDFDNAVLSGTSLIGECLSGNTTECGNSSVGECEYGIRTCATDGVLGDCEGAVYAVEEVCDDGLDNDCDNETDEDCPTGGGSSGGGGGGGSSFVSQPSTIDITTTQDTSVELGQNDEVNFDVRGSSHNVQVIAVSPGHVVLVLSSNPVTIVLRLGETREVDLDGDFLPDVAVTLDKVVSYQAYLTFKELEYIPTPIPTLEPTVTPTIVVPAVCIEDWSCSEWSSCVKGKTVRNCEDVKNCGTEKIKPVTEMDCTNWRRILIWVAGLAAIVLLIVWLINLKKKEF